MEKIATRSWKWTRVGTLVHSLLAYASCCPEHMFPRNMIFYETDIMDGSARAGDKFAALDAGFQLESLDMLPMDLGKQFPNIRKISYLFGIAAPSTPPISRHKRNAHPCAKVTCLNIKCLLSGSLASLEWIKLFFPGVSKLIIDIKGLPIQHGASIDNSQLEVLKMEGVTGLKLTSSRAMKEYPSLFDNLRLFPGLKILTFDMAEPGVALESMLKDEREFPSVECLAIDNGPVSKELLIRAMKVFPSLRELFISEESFSTLIAGFSGTSPSDSPFRPLTKLSVDCNYKAVCFNSSMANVFPSVTKIRIKNFPFITFPTSESNGAVDTIKEATITGMETSCPPSYFGLLFPNMESLSMAGFEFRTLLGNDYSREKNFFARLKHLDISRNRYLRDIGGQMRLFELNSLPQLHQPSSLPKRSRPSTCDAASQKLARDITPAKSKPTEPLAPNLESLDIRDTFHSNNAPAWFFEAFPNIKKLVISSGMFLNSEKNTMHHLFKPLKNLSLVCMDVGHLQIPHPGLVSGIMRNLEEAVETRPTVQFFASCSPEPIIVFTFLGGRYVEEIR